MNCFIQKTKDFDRWHHSLRDLRAKVAVACRIDRAANGSLGVSALKSASFILHYTASN